MAQAGTSQGLQGSSRTNSAGQTDHNAPPSDPGVAISPTDDQLDEIITASLTKRSRRRSTLSFLKHDRRPSVKHGRPSLSDAGDDDDDDSASDARLQASRAVSSTMPEDERGHTINLMIKRTSTFSGLNVPQPRKSKTRAAQQQDETQQPDLPSPHDEQNQAPGPSAQGQIAVTDTSEPHATVAPASSTQSRAESSTPLPSHEPSAVNLMADNKAEREAAAREVKKQRAKVKREYVWDVLFENQRGIMFMGTPFFSSSSLLPFDPPAFTIPSHVPCPALARPTTAHAAEHDPPTHQALDTRDVLPPEHPRRIAGFLGHGDHPSKSHRARQSIRTPYTPQTYQLPSTEWVWLTPWLINMRQDGLTDERGWEYNYWFRSGSRNSLWRRTFKKTGQGGWGCEIGKLGWGGWVRRRMWVRLRMLTTPDEEEEVLEKNYDEENEDDVPEFLSISPDNSPTQSKVRKDPLPDLSANADPEEDARVVIKTMIEKPLDRERLDLWKTWFGEEAKGDPMAKETVKRIKRVLQDEETAKHCANAMLYDSARQSLLSLWKANGIDVSLEIA